MSYHRLKMTLPPCLFIILLWSASFSSSAQTFDVDTYPAHVGGNGSDEDTILIEQEQRYKISYGRALKAICKQLFKFDIDKTFSTGKNKRSDVIRHLDDLSERSHYSIRLDRDEIKLKFSLNL